VWLAELWDVGPDRRCTGWRPKIVAAARPTHFDFKEKKNKATAASESFGFAVVSLSSKSKKEKGANGFKYIGSKLLQILWISATLCPQKDVLIHRTQVGSTCFQIFCLSCSVHRIHSFINLCTCIYTCVDRRLLHTMSS
jgi:hypothetical protein